MLNQVKEVSRRIEGLAASATERVQHNMETARSEAVDRFVSRLREQVAPMLADAKESIQKLETSQTAFKKESDAIYTGLENQLEFSANESLAKVQQQLENKTAAISAKTNETLSKLYQHFEKAAQDNVESLLASVGSQMTRILQERAAEVSREFSTGLEGYTRNYLESIGKSIAEIPRNMPSCSGK
jgi:exonuclease VII large subunit